MRLFHHLKLLGLVLALSTIAPVVTIPFQSRSVAVASPLPRRSGDPDTPEWTIPSPGPSRTTSSATATNAAPTWRELLQRVFRKLRIAG